MLFPLSHMTFRELQLPEPVMHTPGVAWQDPWGLGGQGEEPQGWDLSPSFFHNFVLFGTEASGLQTPGWP